MNKNTQAVAIFDKCALGYEQKFMNVGLYANTLNLLCSAMDTHQNSVLELACGPGNITKYVLSQKPNLKILATDLSPNMLKRAKTNNPNIDTCLLDATNLSTLNKNFDVIICGFLLPYLSKEEAITLIQDASNNLYQTGLFYISTMEDDYVNSSFETGSTGDSIFMHYHQCDYLSEALLNNGFKVLKTERIKSVMTNGKKVIDLILIAQKK